MAFAVTSRTKVIHEQVGTRGTWAHQVVVEDCGPTDQFLIPIPSEVGAIVLLHMYYVSGTGNTLQPAIGAAENFDPTDPKDPAFLQQQTLAAARVYDPSNMVYFVTNDGIWIQPTPDAGADNKIVTRVVIAAGVPA